MKKVFFLVLCSFFLMGLKLTSEAQVLEGPPRDGVYDKTAITQVQPIPYTYLREADVIWTRRIWRVIDFREKMNEPFYFPERPQNSWRSFVTIIMDGLREGTITAYSSESDQFLVPLTYKEVKDKLEREDTVKLPRPDNPDIMFDTVIKTEFDPANVKKLKIKEDFYFDRQRSEMAVRILGICPVVDEIDKTTGEKRFEKNLFWIYFPECRNLFAKNEMFNMKNGSAGRLTYDDVFMKRIFSSYIYKEENVYDRSINEYTVGVDALLEAEKAKNSLFEFESDLWEY
ncbi:MAG: gliding motility protein GldN [Bacteroidales bacterium]|nr:gliding motility protein GldN [Bacteroidales bacterium]MDD4602288.1 gliding motility protein GldN [Bacteroidales bacterium]